MSTHATSDPPPASRRVAELRTEEWCWSHINAEDHGTMSYETSRGRIRRAVHYTVGGGRVIVVPVAELGQARLIASSGLVTLEVRGVGVDDSVRWLVRVTAAAILSGHADPDRSRRAHPSNGATASDLSCLRLMLLQVRGFSQAA